jgi:opacity protein-like surface antigen
MKKVSIAFFASLLIMTGSAFGQAPNSNLHFGLKLSPMLSWTNSDIEGLEDDGSAIGFTYGLMMDFDFTSNYAISTGIELSHRKGKTKNDSLSFKYNLQYIDLPVALKLRTNEIGYITYYGKFGFIPGINVKATYDLESSTDLVADDDDVKFSSDINAFNLGLIVGGGIHYGLSGNTAIMVELLYNNGFIDILKEDGNQLKTSYVALNLGVYF